MAASWINSCRLALSRANSIMRLKRGISSRNFISSSPCTYSRRQNMKSVLTNWSCTKKSYDGQRSRMIIVTERLYCSSAKRCWNCNAELSRSETSSGGPRVAALFCASCNMIQPLEDGLNHFQIMGMEEKFDVEVQDLTNCFRNLQRLLHPDKFSNKSETEQNYSAAQSSAVNRAYKVLLKPLSRGLYLLELRGFAIEEGESNIEPLFLMEVMEINEELADTDDLETVRRIGKENTVSLNDHLDKLRVAFDEANYPQARELLMRLKYYANIDDKVKEKVGTN
nr:iron-sulfur cluster co-chaperone protein HscB-like [Lytechinus pictus]